MAVDTKMTKSAGEHWVCSMLARYGWAPALTRDGIERTDILAVSTEDDRRMVEIQVKTARVTGDFNKASWVINSKAQEVARSDREFFALVLLPSQPTMGPPMTYIVPRDHLAAATWIVHQHWLKDSSVMPGTRNTPVSHARLRPWVFEHYMEQWSILHAPTEKIPVLLDYKLRGWMENRHIGLPAGHPWYRGLPEWLDLSPEPLETSPDLF